MSHPVSSSSSYLSSSCSNLNNLSNCSNSLRSNDKFSSRMDIGTAVSSEASSQDPSSYSNKERKRDMKAQAKQSEGSQGVQGCCDEKSSTANGSSSEESENEDSSEEGLSGWLSDSQSLDRLPSKRLRLSDSSESLMISDGSYSVQEAQVQRYAKLFGGKLSSSSLVRGRGGNSSLSFKCGNGHNFSITLCKLQQLETISLENDLCCNCWCLKCKNFFEKCSSRAEKENCSVLSSNGYSSQINLRCSQGHSFSVRYSRDLPKSWCKSCRQQELLSQKQKQELLN